MNAKSNHSTNCVSAKSNHGTRCMSAKSNHGTNCMSAKSNRNFGPIFQTVEHASKNFINNDVIFIAKRQNVRSVDESCKCFHFSSRNGKNDKGQGTHAS